MKDPSLTLKAGNLIAMKMTEQVLGWITECEVIFSFCEITWSRALTGERTLKVQGKFKDRRSIASVPFNATVNMWLSEDEEAAVGPLQTSIDGHITLYEFQCSGIDMPDMRFVYNSSGVCAASDSTSYAGSARHKVWSAMTRSQVH